MEDRHVVLEGATSFRRTLSSAQDEINDLRDIHRQAGDIILAAARAPRRTGRLASSARITVTAKAARISYGVAYAAPIHWGWSSRNITPQPWLVDAAKSTESQWVKSYEKHVDGTLGKIKGL